MSKISYPAEIYDSDLITGIKTTGNSGPIDLTAIAIRNLREKYTLVRYTSLQRTMNIPVLTALGNSTLQLDVYLSGPLGTNFAGFDGHSLESVSIAGTSIILAAQR